MSKVNIIPLASNRVWRTYQGGINLDHLAGKQDPSDSHFPEDWIASMTTAVNPGREHLSEEGLSMVSVNGQQQLLKHIVEENPREILGSRHFAKYGLSTSFLIKLLDSASRLHIQCHPTIKFAREHLESDFGKTEGYYILGTRDDIREPYIYLGFQHPPTRERLREAIEAQDIVFLESCFEKIPVKKGDTFLVPGGLPHAIGEGIFMIEIMEPTDLVVRIEFEKEGYILPEKARFMNRGIDFGLSMFDLTPISILDVRSRYFINERLHRSNNTAEEYVIFDRYNTSCFRMNKLVVRGEYLLAHDSFCIMIITDGVGRIQSGDEWFDAKFGDKFFIPASTKSILIQTDSQVEVILAMPPD